jgi:hypothetical protein
MKGLIHDVRMKSWLQPTGTKLGATYPVSEIVKYHIKRLPKPRDFGSSFLYQHSHFVGVYSKCGYSDVVGGSVGGSVGSSVGGGGSVGSGVGGGGSVGSGVGGGGSVGFGVGTGGSVGCSVGGGGSVGCCVAGGSVGSGVGVRVGLLVLVGSGVGVRVGLRVLVGRGV